MAHIETTIYLNVDKGTPVLFYRGDFDINTTYVYNHEYRDYVRVWDDSTNKYYYFTVRNRWDEVKGVKPVPSGTNTKWEEAAQLGFLAAGAITADMIDVDSLIVENLKTAPNGERIEITKQSNALKAYNSNGNEVLAIKGKPSDINIGFIESNTLPEVNETINITTSGVKTWTRTLRTFSKSIGSIVLPKILLSVESTIYLQDITVGLKLKQGTIERYICKVSKELANNRLSSLAISPDSFVLSPLYQSELILEIKHDSGFSNSGKLTIKANWGGSSAVEYGTYNITEFSSDGFTLTTAGSYYQIKRSNGNINVLSRNVRSRNDGYILSGSYDPVKGITFAEGDDFYMDEASDNYGWVITHNLGSKGYSVVANIVNPNISSFPYGRSLLVSHKNTDNVRIAIFNSSGTVDNSLPFDFVIYGKRV